MFTDVVAPRGTGTGNHKGTSEHAEWLHDVFAEFVVLGIVTEVDHVPFVVNPLNVIPKGNYDADNEKLKQSWVRFLATYVWFDNARPL